MSGSSAAQAATKDGESVKDIVPTGVGPNPGRVVSGFGSLAPETLLDETAVAQALRRGEIERLGVAHQRSTARLKSA